MVKCLDWMGVTYKWQVWLPFTKFRAYLYIFSKISVIAHNSKWPTSSDPSGIILTLSVIESESHQLSYVKLKNDIISTENCMGFSQ